MARLSGSNPKSPGARSDPLKVCKDRVQVRDITIEYAGSTLYLDEGRNSGNELDEVDPERDLLQSALLDGKVVQLQSGSAIEDLVKARNGVKLLKNVLITMNDDTAQTGPSSTQHNILYTMSRDHEYIPEQ